MLPAAIRAAALVLVLAALACSALFSEHASLRAIDARRALLSASFQLQTRESRLAAGPGMAHSASSMLPIHLQPQLSGLALIGGAQSRGKSPRTVLDPNAGCVGGSGAIRRHVVVCAWRCTCRLVCREVCCSGAFTTAWAHSFPAARMLLHGNWSKVRFKRCLPSI